MPGMVISRRHAAEALAIRLMSASIAGTAVITAVRAAIRPRVAAERPAIPSLALRALSMKPAVCARGSRTPNTTARPRIWFSKVTRWPTNFLRATFSERMACAGSDFTCAGLKKPVRAKCANPRASLRSILWVASDLARLLGLPALDAGDRKAELAQPVKQDRRHSSRFEYDATTPWRLRQFAGDHVRRRRRLANHHAFAVKNANMGLIHRDISRPAKSSMFGLLQRAVGGLEGKFGRSSQSRRLYRLCRPQTPCRDDQRLG